jgi:hypothetical protein
VSQFLENVMTEHVLYRVGNFYLAEEVSISLR